MAQSETTQQRARLIREMNRDLNQTRHSSASSTSSRDQHTMSEFDPENEAIISTQQFENTILNMPQLRASAQKYSRYHHVDVRGVEHAIDTSTMERAFPDFTQGRVSSENGSISIEMGRGLKHGSNVKSGRVRDYSSIGDDSMDLSVPTVGGYQVMSTPPVRPHPISKKTGERERETLRRDHQVRHTSGLHKQITDPSPPLQKTTDYASGGSQQGSTNQRRTLSAMHARVRDADDVTQLTEDRPPTVDLTSKSTRFASARNHQTNDPDTMPSKFTSAKGLVQAFTKDARTDQRNTKAQNDGNIGSDRNQMTQQSFMLPDMPNLSELVSGVYQDGTPVFSKHGKSRASRFVSAAHGREPGPNYAAISEIPLPADENAIFLSLKLLQDKVADLEDNRAEAENSIRDLQQKNKMLEAEKAEIRRWQRSDSALGMTSDGGSDGGHEMGRGFRKWAIEKNRLESSLRGLQEQGDITNRTLAVSTTKIKNLKQERDAAVSQLSIAYITTEHLKSENEALTEENRYLRAQIAQLTAEREDERVDQTKRADENRIGGAQKNDVSGPLSTKTLTKAMKHGHFQHQQQRSSAKDSQAPAVVGASRGGADGAQSLITSLTAEDVRRGHTRTKPTTGGKLSNVDEKVISTEPQVSTATSSGFQRKPVVGDIQLFDLSGDSVIEGIHEPTKSRPQGKPSAAGTQERTKQLDETSPNVTYLSFLDNQEIAKLRKTLEEERIALKHQRAANRRAPALGSTATQIREPNQNPAYSAPIPRKSSMKDTTGRKGQDAGDSENIEQRIVDTDRTTRTNASSSQSIHHPEDSVMSRRSQRHSLRPEEMTSAFILPDITLHKPLAGAQFGPEPTSATQKTDENENLANHHGQNCTVCNRFIECGTAHEHEEHVKETVTIPKPVRVSERMPTAGEYDEEPTIRPSQPPALALATVMKELQDELAHLKLQLGQYQTLYSQHDPALSKRKRKSVYTQIEDLLKAIEIKADQIYALYDVLEGQKDGHEISEREVEVTLQSIGIETEDLESRGGNDEKEGKKESMPWDLESESEEEGWEGIESTKDVTGQRRRSSVA